MLLYNVVHDRANSEEAFIVLRAMFANRNQDGVSTLKKIVIC